MVKSQKVWKIEFFKNDDEHGGAMAEAIKHCSEEQIVIHSQTKKNGRLWGCIKPEQFVNMLQSNYGLYEVITKFPHKVYFDIDCKVDRLCTEEEFQNVIDNTLVHLEPFFPNAQFAISGSNTETKISLHIVLQNYVIHNEDERQYMKHLVKYIYENWDKWYDWKVYTKNRNMKCINQSKDDGRVQQIITNDDYKAHCITCFVPDYSLPFQELPENVKEEVMISKSKGTFDLGQLPKLVLSTPEDFDVASASPLDILQLLPLNSSFNHDYTHLIARFCYYNNLSFETFLAWLQKKHQDMRPDIVNKWHGHWNKLEKFPPVQKDRMLTLLKYYYPHITKDIHYRKFVETFNLPQANIVKIETMNQSCFYKPNKKYFCFNVGMGGGKTAQTITYLKTEPNFLWIAPNKALATNTHKRFEDENVSVCHYEAIKTKAKKDGKMKDEERLICCLNSIHYITDVEYDVLVIDEIETLIDKFLGDFLEQGKAQLKQQVWLNFVQLFRKAKKVLLLDAFITTKTINLIQYIEKTLEHVVIFERISEPQTRTIKYMDNDKAMLHDIITKLNQGSKLFIFYPYKNATYNTKSGNISSMEQIYGLITTATGKEGIFYNADVDDKVKKGLKDVNTSWENMDFVITNNIITCGVNYENMDFDYKYIFIASHNTPRDIIQVSYRARHLNSGIIKLCYMGKMNQNNTWLNDCSKMGCRIYSQMYNDILVEKKAPLKRSFQLFCVKAHYKQTTDEYKINQNVETELERMLEKQNVGMSYSSIENIDWSQAEYIEEKCFAQEATMADKFALNKYYFKKSFLDTADDSTLAEIWDGKFAFFFKRLGTILTDERHLFNEIAKNNKFTKFFPTDVKKTKLTDELKERVFKEFSFKFITAGSSTTKIVKEIYNTYFNKHVIASTYDSNKHVNYSVDEMTYTYYEFAKQNLILDSLTYMTFNNMQEQSDDEQEFCVEI
jgi:hypothetical protein